MPQTVGELEQPDRSSGDMTLPSRVRLEKSAIPGQPFLFALADMARSVIAFELAKSARKGELLIVVQRLIPEYRTACWSIGVNAARIAAGRAARRNRRRRPGQRKPAEWDETMSGI